MAINCISWAWFTGRFFSAAGIFANGAAIRILLLCSLWLGRRLAGWPDFPRALSVDFGGRLDHKRCKFL